MAVQRQKIENRMSKKVEKTALTVVYQNFALFDHLSLSVLLKGRSILRKIYFKKFFFQELNIKYQFINCKTNDRLLQIIIKKKSIF